jgi:hypothetical protein
MNGISLKVHISNTQEMHVYVCKLRVPDTSNINDCGVLTELKNCYI